VTAITEDGNITAGHTNLVYIVRLNQIRDVVAIADHGSLRSAAQHLGLAQPALTRSIRELEHELKVDLFERHARGMALTPYGEARV
jgi:LysR family transcriptional regulator of abg operon